MRQFNLFHVVNYMVPWLTSTHPLTAPETDFLLLKNIVGYAKFSSSISKIALEAFQRYLWYLSPHCVPLAFFDNKVDFTTKSKMVQKLKLPMPLKKGSRPPMRATLPKGIDATRLATP